MLGRGSEGALTLWEQAEGGKEEDLVKMGEIKDERISRLIWLGYLGGKTVASEAARQSVIEGIMDMVGRPVGTVETQVV